MGNKIILLSGVLSSVIFFSSCNSGTKTAEAVENTSDSSEIEKTEGSPTTTTTSTFDITKIPISNAELGEFPFFSFPENLETQNKPVERSFDRLFFPIDGIMTPVEGKVWKGNIVVVEGKENWSLPYFEKSYEEAIKNVGGVKIFDARVAKTEIDRIKDQATYFGEEGSIDYWNEPVRVYLIRRENQDDIYIQLSGSTSSGKLQILQKTPFKQTITLLKSDEIKRKLDESGKAVLHINFDTDKATLKPDGKAAVEEIIKVLQTDNNLKLAINGYTDNSGSEDHNLELSSNRAKTVENEIINSGVDKNRLSSNGFGSKNPIAENTSEEGKAQNRRVELVKK